MVARNPQVIDYPLRMGGGSGGKQEWGEKWQEQEEQEEQAEQQQKQREQRGVAGRFPTQHL